MAPQWTLPLAVLAALLAAACAALFRGSAKLRREVSALAAALDAERHRPPPEPPPRLYQSRQTAFALLWFPELTVDDARKLVVSVHAGVPHCPKCLRAMTLCAGQAEAGDEWTCSSCGDRRADTAADFTVAQSIEAEAVREFLALRADYRPGPSLQTDRKNAA